MKHTPAILLYCLLTTQFVTAQETAPTEPTPPEVTPASTSSAKLRYASFLYSPDEFELQINNTVVLRGIFHGEVSTWGTPGSGPSRLAGFPRDSPDRSKPAFSGSIDIQHDASNTLLLLGNPQDPGKFPVAALILPRKDDVDYFKKIENKLSITEPVSFPCVLANGLPNGVLLVKSVDVVDQTPHEEKILPGKLSQLPHIYSANGTFQLKAVQNIDDSLQETPLSLPRIEQVRKGIYYLIVHQPYGPVTQPQMTTLHSSEMGFVGEDQ